MPRTITAEDARAARRALQGLWLIVSARHNDAVASDVEGIGKRLAEAVERGDLEQASAAMSDACAWLSTYAGVAMRRLSFAIEEPIGYEGPKSGVAS